MKNMDCIKSVLILVLVLTALVSSSCFYKMEEPGAKILSQKIAPVWKDENSFQLENNVFQLQRTKGVDFKNEDGLLYQLQSSDKKRKLIIACGNEFCDLWLADNKSAVYFNMEFDSRMFYYWRGPNIIECEHPSRAGKDSVFIWGKDLSNVTYASNVLLVNPDKYLYCNVERKEGDLYLFVRSLQDNVVMQSKDIGTGGKSEYYYSIKYIFTVFGLCFVWVEDDKGKTKMKIFAVKF